MTRKPSRLISCSLAWPQPLLVGGLTAWRCAGELVTLLLIVVLFCGGLVQRSWVLAAALLVEPSSDHGGAFCQSGRTGTRKTLAAAVSQ
jgi:hypothetical protein